MQTPFAQIAALVIFGNDVLRGRSRPDFWPGASVFKFCGHVRFVTLTDAEPRSEQAFADDPVQWIASLHDAGATGLLLHQFVRNKGEDRMLAGFVGGGRRLLVEALRGELSDWWEARWQARNKGDLDGKIWDVTYGRIACDWRRAAYAGESLRVLKNALEIALSRIEAFATRKNLAPFDKAFLAALEALNSDEPLSKTYNSDFAPSPEMSLVAKQLLGAAQHGWVFGAMGSWNDIGFQGQDGEEYLQVSDQLYDLLNRAICAAVNSYSAIPAE